MNKKHIHRYIPGRSGKVAICICGRFKHINLKPEDIIVGIPAAPIRVNSRPLAVKKQRLAPRKSIQ